MKITQIHTYSPTFKDNIMNAGPSIPYPELKLNYQTSAERVKKSDAFTSNIFAAAYQKIKDAFGMLFTPNIDKTAKNIQSAIDETVDSVAFSSSNIDAKKLLNVLG